MAASLVLDSHIQSGIFPPESFGLISRFSFWDDYYVSKMSSSHAKCFIGILVGAISFHQTRTSSTPQLISHWLVTSFARWANRSEIRTATYRREVWTHCFGVPLFVSSKSPTEISLIQQEGIKSCLSTIQFVSNKLPSQVTSDLTNDPRVNLEGQIDLIESYQSRIFGESISAGLYEILRDLKNFG